MFPRYSYQFLTGWGETLQRKQELQLTRYQMTDRITLTDTDIGAPYAWFTPTTICVGC